MKRTMTIIALSTALVGPIAAAPALAESQPNADRVEDWIDRRESIRDERYDRGPLDVMEDRADRIESVLDRNGIEATPRMDRIERRSVRRRF